MGPRSCSARSLPSDGRPFESSRPPETSPGQTPLARSGSVPALPWGRPVQMDPRPQVGRDALRGEPRPTGVSASLVSGGGVVAGIRRGVVSLGAAGALGARIKHQLRRQASEWLESSASGLKPLTSSRGQPECRTTPPITRRWLTGRALEPNLGPAPAPISALGNLTATLTLRSARSRFLSHGRQPLIRPKPVPPHKPQ